MEANEKDCSAFGGLFQTVMSDLRGSSLVWEDFTTKATKLHTTLKTTLTAIAAFLDAFQKIADMATGSKGATKEIGSALTRLCLRHKAIETKLKKFTGTILDHLVSPLQECMEEWKKTVVQLDKEHAKEYKRSRQEIKKCASDTVRLQKKMKKGKSDIQGRLDSAMQEVNDKYILLEEQEKNAARTALIEERGRFCVFISCLKPFVDEEVGVLTEVTHLQEIMESLCLQADNPKSLPASSEQVLLDMKGSETNSWHFQKHIPKIILIGSQTPPSSPSSLGSRKSSMCSISSIASSSSGSAQSHSPCHNKTIQQSSDNVSQGTDTLETESTPSTPSESYPNTPSATSTWTNWPNQPVKGNNKTEQGRPHTISTAYEKSHHSRPALTQQLFEPLQPGMLEGLKSTHTDGQHDPAVVKRERPHSAISMPYSRPSASINKMQPVLPPLGPKPISRAVAPPKVPSMGEQPVYANLSELAGTQGEEVDTDRTPTTRDPPMSSMGQMKIQQNSMELAAAIKELEASTAALECSYDPDTQASQSSLQCSSGYGTMNSTPAGSEDTIASGGIPVSAQGGSGGVLARRSSMNTPKPPPPVRRTSSITSAPNSAVLQKYRASPPRQLNTQQTVQSNSLQRNAQQQNQSNHRRSLSASGSSGGSEPAYAELSEIQQSIQARQQQQQQEQQIHGHHVAGQGYLGGQPGPGVNTMSAPVTPQYAQPVTNPGHLIANSSVVNSLNAKFSAMNSQQTGSQNTQYHSNIQNPVPSTGYQTMSNTQPHPNIQNPVPGAGYQTNCNNPMVGTNPGGGGADFPDLPPPPTADELREIEQIYSVPKQIIPQTQSYDVQTQNNSVQMRHMPQAQNPSTMPGGVDMRQSLISEMKAGNKFRKFSTDGDGSEC